MKGVRRGWPNAINPSDFVEVSLELSGRKKIPNASPLESVRAGPTPRGRGLGRPGPVKEAVLWCRPGGRSAGDSGFYGFHGGGSYGVGWSRDAVVGGGAGAFNIGAAEGLPEVVMDPGFKATSRVSYNARQARRRGSGQNYPVFDAARREHGAHRCERRRHLATAPVEVTVELKGDAASNGFLSAPPPGGVP